MSIVLTDTEITIFNKLIPRLKFHDDFILKNEIRDLINSERETWISAGNTNDANFDMWQLQTAKKIISYLNEEKFVNQRDEAKYYLNEKGKNLRKQGSIEKYNEWLAEFRAKNHRDLRQIEAIGYLDQDEIVRNRPRRKLSKLILYPSILVLIILILAALENKYKFIESNPTLSHLFHKDKDNDNGKDDK